MLFRSIHRAAYLVDDRLEACAYFSRRPELPARNWLISLFARGHLQNADRHAILAGRPLRAAQDTGPIVCSCFAVGRNTLCKLIASAALTDSRQVGEQLRAGTHCGSCLTEIEALLARRGLP